MKSIGLCTHFSETDRWAFNYALHLAQSLDSKLTICHWLQSPYKLRRDLVQDDLFSPTGIVAITPRLLAKFELQLREYYEPLLGDFDEVGFKLCEGQYQVELVRCFRQHLLEVVVMGYQMQVSSEGQSLVSFARQLDYPLIIVGSDGENSFWLNESAFAILPELDLPEGRWQLLSETLLETTV